MNLEEYFNKLSKMAANEESNCGNKKPEDNDKKSKKNSSG